MSLSQVVLVRCLATACLFLFAAECFAQPSSHWTFDDVATDSAGSRDLTLQGVTAYSTNTAPGFGGKSIDLTAGGNGATYNVMGADAISGSYTVSLWVNPSVGSGGPTSTFFGTRGPSDTSFDAKFQNGDTLHGDIGRGTGWIDTSADSNIIDYQANQWHHVAYSVNPTGYTAYINGVQVASEGFGPDTPLLFDATHDIAVGAARTNLSENFTGLIDDVKVFDSALSQAQIRQAMVPDGHSPITSLYSTGVDDSGNVLAPGATDPHYDITSTPGGGAFGDALVQSNHPAWLANDSVGSPGSSFISVTDTGTNSIAGGDYIAETMFNLTGFDPDTAVINGLVATDNSIQDVILNGNSLGITASGFADYDPISIDTGFVDGINTLEFVFNNAGAGPGGFRANLSGSAVAAAVPEPASVAVWSLIGLGLAGFGYTRVRRKK